jgi:hypothetical protein
VPGLSVSFLYFLQTNTTRRTTTAARRPRSVRTRRRQPFSATHRDGICPRHPPGYSEGSLQLSWRDGGAVLPLDGGDEVLSWSFMTTMTTGAAGASMGGSVMVGGPRRRRRRRLRGLRELMHNCWEDR